MNKKKHRTPLIKCFVCGQFMSQADLEDKERHIIEDPTGFNDFEPRDFIFAHRYCYERSQK